MRYRLHNMTIDSDIHLASLRTDTGAGIPDLLIRQGRVAFDLGSTLHESSWYQLSCDAFVVEIGKVGRFRVWRGRTITVDRFAGASDNDVALYLLGSVMAGALLLRGVFLLHACAVAKDGGAILLAGESGAGKSTLTAALVKQGCHLISDDVCLLTLEDDRVMVHPGNPHIRLWASSLELLDIPVDGLELVTTVEEKYYWPVNDSYAAGPQPVDAFLELTAVESPEPLLATISGADKILTLVRNTYRGEFIEYLCSHDESFSYWSSIAGRFPLFRLCRQQNEADADAASINATAVAKFIMEVKPWRSNQATEHSSAGPKISLPAGWTTNI